MTKDWMVKESELEKDDYEYRVLHATLDKSCIVSGCAGSGKSVLALIKAQRIQREKNTNNYQIIVFTKALCKYMNAGRSELGLNKQFTYHWKFQKDGCPTSDYMIVDEIQDFTKDEILQFINSTNKHFFFFGDTAQSIYDGLKKTMPVNRISSIVPYNKDFEIFNLLHNYRLPLPVAKVVQVVGVGLPPFSESVYKSSETAIPRFIQYNSFDEQMDAVAKILNNNGNVTDVGILTPHNIGVKRLSDILNKKNIDHEAKYDVYEDEYGNEVYERESHGKQNKWIRTVDNLDFTTENPKVMTYHSAKGLQFGTVFLPGIAPLSTDPQRRISEQKALYVAMTRTYRNLYVMYSGNLPFPLSNVPMELFKITETDTDTVEDI